MSTATVITDTDFLGFTFNGQHCLYDLKVYRVINGDRYTYDMAPQRNELTAEASGADGMFFFGERHKQKNFNVDVAFEDLSESEFKEWKKFCNNKDICDLIFDEEPYKVYSAKITGTPQFKVIPFDIGGERVYRGEGTI